MSSCFMFEVVCSKKTPSVPLWGEVQLPIVNSHADDFVLICPLGKRLVLRHCRLVQRHPLQLKPGKSVAVRCYSPTRRHLMQSTLHQMQWCPYSSEEHRCISDQKHISFSVAEWVYLPFFQFLHSTSSRDSPLRKLIHKVRFFQCLDLDGSFSCMLGNNNTIRVLANVHDHISTSMRIWVREYTCLRWTLPLMSVADCSTIHLQKDQKVSDHARAVSMDEDQWPRESMSIRDPTAG